MKREIAVVICNYNKKEYVKKNIESLNRQDMGNFDIYVVDNASTDGTADELREIYQDSVVLICNERNLGGSGGFNTGIRFVMKHDYQFIVLLDNDVVLKENTIGQLYEDMVNNPDIGIMGAKILKMDYPTIIQEFAPTLNYTKMTFELNHGGETDTDQLPHLVDCDYVPACALMVRREVVEIIGCMPEENFIYYDDIEWGVKCHRAGYRVVANSYATVWHKGGAVVNPTTFGSYYLNRNKIRFFMTYMQTEKKDEADEKQISCRIERILRDMYEGIYSCYEKMPNVAKTRMDALLDALEGVTGRAMDYIIREREKPQEKFDQVVLKSHTIKIYTNGLYENARRIINYINELEVKHGWKASIDVIDQYDSDKNNILGYKINRSEEMPDEGYDLVLHVCQHIYELEAATHDKKWVDGWRNVLFDEDDWQQWGDFFRSYSIFKLCFEERVRFSMRRISGDFYNA